MPGISNINDLPSTFTVASNFLATIRFEAAKDPEAIEYIAPDYNMPESNPYIVKGPITLTSEGRCPKGMKDAPAYVLGNLFGLKGVRVTVDAVSPMALAGGMESSNVFLTSLLACSSMLADAGLSEADVFSLAVKLENDEFGGLTGGQGHLCCLLGGAHRHMWLSGAVDSYAAFSTTTIKPEALTAVEQHMFLVQAGKEYLNGEAVTTRAAALTNHMWTDLLRDQDSEGYPLHKEKIELTAKYTAALEAQDFATVVDVVDRYVEIRDTITCRWLSLAIDAKEGKEGLPAPAQGYAKRAFESKDKEWDIVRSMYAQHKGGLAKMSLYTLDPIKQLLEKGRKEKVALMPLGAGGPGANLVAISAQGEGHLRKFLGANDLGPLTEDKVRDTMRGTGLLKGYVPLRAGAKPLQFKGWEQMDLQQPSGPIPLTVGSMAELLPHVKKA